MSNIKGSFPQDDFLKSHHHGLNFNYPSKAIKETTETFITTTTEIAKHVKDTINDIFTNSTEDETDILTLNNNALNGTSFDVNVGSNATSTGNNGTQTVQNTTEGVKVVVGTIRTTIENVTNYVTSTASDIITTTMEEGEDTSESDMHTDSLKTYHIIVTVLIIILFIIGLGLFALYMYYKKRNQAHFTGHYHTQSSREIPTSTDRNPNDSMVIHQQSTC